MCVGTVDGLLQRGHMKQSLLQIHPVTLPPGDVRSAAAAPMCFDLRRPAQEQHLTRVPFSEWRGLFSADGKFISSEDGATPMNFIHTCCHSCPLSPQLPWNLFLICLLYLQTSDAGEIHRCGWRPIISRRNKKRWTRAPYARVFTLRCALRAIYRWQLAWCCAQRLPEIKY